MVESPWMDDVWELVQSNYISKLSVHIWYRTPAQYTYASLYILSAINCILVYKQFNNDDFDDDNDNDDDEMMMMMMMMMISTKVGERVPVFIYLTLYIASLCTHHEVFF